MTAATEQARPVGWRPDRRDAVVDRAFDPVRSYLSAAPAARLAPIVRYHVSYCTRAKVWRLGAPQRDFYAFSFITLLLIINHHASTHTVGYN